MQLEGAFSLLLRFLPNKGSAAGATLSESPGENLERRKG